MITQEWKEAFAGTVHDELNKVDRGFNESVNEILFVLRKGVNLRNDLERNSATNPILYVVDGREDEIRQVLRNYYDNGFCGLESAVEKISEIVQRQEPVEESSPEFPNPLDFSDPSSSGFFSSLDMKPDNRWSNKMYPGWFYCPNIPEILKKARDS